MKIDYKMSELGKQDGVKIALIPMENEYISATNCSLDCVSGGYLMSLSLAPEWVAT
jgi:hypothetical protein